MKFSALLFILIASAGCSSVPAGSRYPISSIDLERIKIGITTQNELIALFGLPSSQTSSRTETILTYGGNSLSGQRLTAEFAQGTNILRSILWVPNETEPESRLEFLQKRYPHLTRDTKFNEIENPHDLSRSSVFRDEISKQVVLYDERRSRVEAIGWYEGDVREPATSNNKSNRKFDIGRKL